MAEKLDKSAVEHLSEALSEPGWLRDRRLQALDLFEKLDFPDPKGEEWRYTDVRGFDFERFAAPTARSSAPAISPDLTAKGVRVLGLRDALEQEPDLVKEHFFTEVLVDEHKFTALHGALYNDAVFVYVPRGVEVSIPLEVMRRVDAGGSTFPHTTIVVDEDTLGFEAIREVGPGGHFFGAEHTQSRYKTAFHKPILSDWRNYETWADDGALTATQRANRIWKQLLREYEPPPQDPARAEAIESYVARRRREIGARPNGG